MTLADQDVPVIAWDEPDGLIPGARLCIPEPERSVLHMC
jgi:hypothetical protein